MALSRFMSRPEAVWDGDCDRPGRAKVRAARITVITVKNLLGVIWRIISLLYFRRKGLCVMSTTLGRRDLLLLQEQAIRPLIEFHFTCHASRSDLRSAFNR